jgi:hypothetical protein
MDKATSWRDISLSMLPAWTGLPKNLPCLAESGSHIYTEVDLFFVPARSYSGAEIP